MASEKVAHVMVADGGDARKRGVVQNNLGFVDLDSEKLGGGGHCRECSLPSGLAQIDLEKHQAVVFFEGYDVRNVQVGAGEEIELVL